MLLNPVSEGLPKVCPWRAVGCIATTSRLYERLPEAKSYHSDAYRAYRAWRSPGRHVVNKGGAVNRNEGLPSVWQGQLNRLARRTNGYARKVEMVVYPWPRRFGASG